MGGRKMLKSTRNRVRSIAASIQLNSKTTLEDTKKEYCSSPNNNTCSRRNPDQCDRCGIQTHHLKMWGRSTISNDQVYRGFCIRCNPNDVPSDVLEEWKEKTAPSAPMKPTRPTEIMCSEDENKQMAAFGMRNQRPALSEKSWLCSTLKRIGRESSSKRQLRSDRSSNTTSTKQPSRRQYPPGRGLAAQLSSRSLTNSVTTSTTTTTNTTTTGSSSFTGFTISSSSDESVMIRGCVCSRCGVQTHKIGRLGRSSLTNDNIYRGTCIQCHADKVPPRIVAEWQATKRENCVTPKVPESLRSRLTMTMVNSSLVTTGGPDLTTNTLL